MSDQNKKKDMPKNEEKKVNREMTTKEMEQVTGGAHLNRPRIHGIH